ncbi:MAG: hypothetical protein C0507_01340 [Cyanobacteria bacterium PR.3.49]|nr:hypothetical protein [Cyanobacteria bacterium PR.3.49]
MSNEIGSQQVDPRKSLTRLPAMETPESVTAQLMPEDELTRRIRKAEEHARRDYAGYRRGVLGFAVLGYLYILFVPIVLALLILGTVWLMMKTRHAYGLEIQFIFGLVIALFAYIRALWVPFDEPVGVKLDRSDYPALFELVDELSLRLNIKIDYVMADDQFNAMVLQRPRLGFFGWYANYVVLGLPLMQALPPAHFKSVLAHEFGHISGNHGKSNAFIYNQRVRLVQILTAMHQHSQIAMLMLVKFYDWYYPRFSASSLVIAREHEKQADIQAAEINSNETSGEALVLTEIKGNHLGNVWASITDRVRQLPTPPDLVYFEIGEKLAQAPEDEEKALDALAVSLRRATDNEDTHPSLSERLRIVDFPEARMSATELYRTVPLQLDKGQTAAEIFFGKKLSSLIQHFSDAWANQMRGSWKNVHLQMLDAERQLQELQSKPEEELTVAEVLILASLITGRDGLKVAMPYYERVLERDPQNGEARFAIGAHLLEIKDERAFDILKTLAEEKTQYGLYACGSLKEHYEKQGMKEALKAIGKTWEMHEQVLLLARGERAGLEQRDLIAEHEISQAAVDIIVEQLRQYKLIKEVYLYRKVMEYLPDQKLYVLAIVPKTNLGFSLDSANFELQNKLAHELQMPGAFIVQVIDSNFNWMKDNAKSLKTALILKQ